MIHSKSLFESQFIGTSFKIPFLPGKFGRKEYPSHGLLLLHCIIVLCWHGYLLHQTDPWESRLLCIVFTASPRPGRVPGTYLLHKWTNKFSGTNGKNREIWANWIPQRSSQKRPFLCILPSYPCSVKILSWSEPHFLPGSALHYWHIYSVQTCQLTCWPEVSHFPMTLGWTLTHSFGHSLG